MHNALGVHLAKSLKDAVDNRTHLCCLELVLSFYLVIQLSSLKQLHHNIEGIL
jgi:hypothetical protein